ncbi:hypothetical protein ABIE65_004544 [Constrictibacter sp. MBR-5]|uniref:hypothetical protein n=1 Tax=Constrictibacter sp. MBR-5 TaxID=3156467 RepID=UPI00339A918E
MPISRRLFIALTGAAGALVGTAAGARGTERDATAAVETVEALRAVPPGARRDGAVRHALGRQVRGDGGGGVFWWDAAAAEAEDGGTVFAPVDGGTGRWRRLIDGDWQAAWFGVRADGVTDDGPALTRAIDAAAGRRLMLPKGTIRISASLAPTASRWHLRGQMPERGQYRSDNTTVVDASAIGAGGWLIRRFDREPPLHETIGPFVHADIDFRLGDTHGFAFGTAAEDGSLDPVRYETVRDRQGQKYVHGVRFEGCRIRGGIAKHGSDEGGRIERSGQRLIFLTKCFESTIEDCTLVGGDVQVETWGCDAPVIRNVRCNNGHLPFLLRRSGWFGVQHRLADIQAESFTFGAVVSDGVQLAATRLRTEANVQGPPRGAGRFDLTAQAGITARVRADDDRVILSGDAGGILFPGLSLIELHGPEGQRDTCLVTAVDGAAVRVWSRGFVFTWSAAAARVVRIHGYALLHGGAHDALIDTSHPDSFPNVPTFVYRPDNGAMFLTGIGKVPGSNGDVRSLVLGNVEPDPTSTRKRMGFANCADTVVAPGWHPFVTVDAPFPGPAETATPQPDAWLYSPRTWAAGGIPFRRVEDETGSRAAWLLRAGAPLEVPVPGAAAAAAVFARSAKDGARLVAGAHGGETRHPLDAAAWTRVDLGPLEAGDTLRLSAEGSLLVAAVRFLRAP